MVTLDTKHVLHYENKIPKVWRQSCIIVILNPGKEASIPKSYRLISLLCHTYKLYERPILNRITSTVESHLIKEQPGFRPGKSCTSQLLNLTQHIEGGFQNSMITGAAFVDLSAAYDTVNHRILIQKKIQEITQYYRSNSLRANPDKTQVTAFHLRNKEVKRSLKVKWSNTELENTDQPKYSGVTLDRTLSYKQHIQR